MEFENIDFSAFIKASTKFKVFCQDLSTEKDQAAAILAFEYTYELAWRTLRKILMQNGIQDINSPRDVFRAAGASGLIDDVEKWFEFLKLRNLTVHTYNEDSALELVHEFPAFQNELDKLLKLLNLQEK